MGKLIELRPAIKPPVVRESAESSGESGETLSFEPIISVDFEDTSGSKRLRTEDLYPVRAEMNPELATAFTLLDEGIRLIDEAIEAHEEIDAIGSDDAIQRFQALLPELFCCRSIGDGFGAVINAIYHSLKSRHGEPLQVTQIKKLGRVVRRIHTEPFIEFDEAVNEIMDLEDSGFHVEPTYFKNFEGLLDE